MENADMLIRELNAEMASFNGIGLYLPEPEAVRNWHERQLIEDAAARFPFWAKLWPSAIAMAEYISENSFLIAGKTVLEIAGGLGLPSLAAASYARVVNYTDIEPAAVLLFSKLIVLHRLTNIEAFTLDWNSFPADLSADFVLLSDVNYDDNSFEPLHNLIHKFLDQGSVVILSTPMRLIGREFISRLLPYAVDQQVKTITSSGIETIITVLVLKRTAFF
jgi:predicted nicotinamide N-methyase